jgi:hypothetical protein
MIETEWKEGVDKREGEEDTDIKEEKEIQKGTGRKRKI